MRRKRLNAFILLCVVGLIAASLLAISSKETRLGLDLKGGVELVYQGQPTGQVTEVTGEDIDRSIEIIRERIDRLGVAEPEVSRLGTAEISVSLPDVTNAERAINQVGTTAQLYFYDWEPNLIGIERRVGGTPGQQPPPEALREMRRLWRDAGRNPQSLASRQLIFSGALPTAYDAVLLASRQEPVEDCTTCSAATPRYYLFSDDEEHRLLAGPESAREDLFVTPTGEERPRDGIVLEVPVGTIVVSEQPVDQSGVVNEEARPGWYALRDRPALSGTDITDPQQNFDQLNQPTVSFGFTDDGRESFHRVTRQIAQRGQANAIGLPGTEQAANLSGHFAVILDNEVQTRPIINFVENPDGIDGRTGAEISGGFQNITEAQDLATILQIGALPINLKLISQTQVSATLGAQALDEGLVAGGVGLALTILFLLVFYRLLGVIASLGLVSYGVLLFALIKLIPITLTLPGIAGLILTIGVAADSNIVIFERIKEEVRNGRPIAAAIATGYRRGIGTIIDANVIILVVAFILFVLATAGVKGFAFTLGVGTLISLFTAVVFTQALLGTMGNTRLLSSPSGLGAGPKRSRWRFDFMGKARWFFSASGVILLIGSFALATKQLNLGIDFESGTRISAALQEPTDEAGVRAALEAEGLEAGEVQQVSDPVLGDNVFQIQTAQLGPERVAEAEEALDSRYGVVEEGFDTTSVGPTFGAQVARSAFTALIFSLLIITGYVAFRFDPKFAVPVLIAIAHDILITAGVYSLTDREVTTGTVAAFLTILGYSLYDTIIVFDRIRENLPRMPRAAFPQVVNRSMSEVLTRSLATTFSTLLPVVALFLFGGETLKDFAFAMMVGVASGTYSSIFIASPVLSAWKEREPVFARRRARIAEITGGTVPAFADEVELAKLSGEETDAEIAAGIEAATGEDGAGAGEGEPASAPAIAQRDVLGQPDPDPVAAAAAEQKRMERRERKEKRRQRQQQGRRKHGRNR